jgi:structural maintenance of chromosomes protein 5
LFRRETLNDKKKDYLNIEKEALRIQQAFAKAKQLCTQIKSQAERDAPMTDEKGNELPLKQQLEDLDVNTVYDVEAALEEAESKANSIDANPDVIRQYEQRKVEIEEAKERLDDLSSSKDAKLNVITRMRQPWESALENFVAKINCLFSKYMAEMACTGEVRLTKGESAGDSNNQIGKFKDWGIEILVSFRENTRAQVLSARVQSGGERSVSTIMYLMALQDMMVAPFRCVDEINQGLDERNERLVFRRIVENSTRPPHGSLTNHSGQYFLITPKLLPNLYDMEEDGVTILFVLNGMYTVRLYPVYVSEVADAAYFFFVFCRSFHLQTAQRMEY